MELMKDILLVDFEGRDTPTQIGAILLDKKTLEEKAHFSSYIQADLKGETSSKSEITQEMLTDAPTQAEVGQMIFEKFGTDLFLGSWVANKDMTYFDILMKAAGVSTWKMYDYHILDIWPPTYLHLLKNGYTGGIGSEEIFQYFGAKPRGNHDALEDCRIAADILRKIFLT